MITLGQVQRDVILVWFLSYGVLRSICIYSVSLHRQGITDVCVYPFNVSRSQTF